MPTGVSRARGSHDLPQDAACTQQCRTRVRVVTLAKRRFPGLAGQLALPPASLRRARCALAGVPQVCEILSCFQSLCFFSFEGFCRHRLRLRDSSSVPNLLLGPS